MLTEKYGVTAILAIQFDSCYLEKSKPTGYNSTKTMFM